MEPEKLDFAWMALHDYKQMKHLLPVLQEDFQKWFSAALYVEVKDSTLQSAMFYTHLPVPKLEAFTFLYAWKYGQRANIS